MKLCDLPFFLVFLCQGVSARLPLASYSSATVEVIMIRRYMICIGSHDVFISPVIYNSSGEDDNESQSKTLTLPLQCESSYALDEESVSAILQDFSHEYLSDVPEDCEIEVQLVVPTRMSIHQREIVIHGVNSMRDGCIRLLGINSSAAALCLAAFGDDERAVAANELLTMSGKRPYCEWDSALKGNQQRRELLSTTEGVLRVLIAEIGKGWYVKLSLSCCNFIWLVFVNPQLSF